MWHKYFFSGKSLHCDCKILAPLPEQCIFGELKREPSKTCVSTAEAIATSLQCWSSAICDGPIDTDIVEVGKLLSIAYC